MFVLLEVPLVFKFSSTSGSSKKMKMINSSLWSLNFHPPAAQVRK